MKHHHQNIVDDQYDQYDQYDEIDIEDEISQEILSIKKYDFKISNIQIDKKTLNKRFSMKFEREECPNCSESFSFDQPIDYTVLIKYQIQDDDDSDDKTIKYPYIFRFNVRIKSSNCEFCNKLVKSPMISKSQFHSISNQFIKIVHETVDEHMKYKKGLKYWYDDWKRALNLLKKQPTQHQRMYDSKQASNKIYQALKKIQKHQLKLSTAEIQKNQKHRNCIRCVNIKLICSKCPNFDKVKDNQWTSICGTLHIKFIVDKKSSAVRFNVQIYSMQCLHCKQYGKSLIYESQLQGIEMQFAHVISQIMDEVPAPNKNSKKQQHIPDIHRHLYDLCQACKLGICVYKKIIKQWNKQTIRVNNKIVADLDMHQVEYSSQSQDQ